MPSSRVLVIDSDPSSLGMLTHGMNRLGLATEGASDAATALSYLKENRPDVVVSDVDPAGGLKVLEHLRRDPEMRNVPVLLLGKGAWARRRSQARELGAQELVAKPAFVQDIAVLTWIYAGRTAGLAGNEQLFEGTFGEPSAAHLLRSLLAGGRSGTLRLDPTNAVVRFADGLIIDATFGGLRGEAALMRILTLEAGSYELTFGRITQTATMQFDLQDLQTRGLAHVRMWEQVKIELDPMSQVLTVDFQNLSSRAPELPRGLFPLIRLFDGQRNIHEVIEASNLDDLTAGQAIAKLKTLKVFEQTPREKWEAATPALGRPTPLDLQGDDLELPPLATEEQLAALQLTHEMILDRAEALAPVDPDHELAFFAASADVHATETWHDHELHREAVLSDGPSTVRIAGWALVGMMLLTSLVLFWRSTPSGEGDAVPVTALKAAPAPAGAAAPKALAPEARAFDQLMSRGAVDFDKEDFKGALAAFEDAQKLDPKSAPAAYAVGFASYELGKLDAAALALNKALLLDPNNGRAEILLGAIAEEKGDKQLARDHYQSYLSLDPDGESAAEVKALLANLGQ